MTNLTWVISSSVLIFAVIAIRAVFGKRMRPGLRYALWGLVLLRLLYPGTVLSSLVSVQGAAEQTEAVRNFEAVRGVDSIEYMDGGVVEGYLRDMFLSDYPVTVAEQATPERFARMETAIRVRDVLGPVWRAGVAITALAFLVANGSFRRALRERRKPLPDADCPLRVYAVENLSSSCLFGHTIYVEAETAADGTRLRHVLAHEMSHYLNCDHIWALLRCVVLALHWYNPLVWWAAALSRQDSELCADALALKRLGEDERESYGATLIELSAHRPQRASLLCTATTMTNGKKSLRERVTMIARRPRMTAAVVIAVVAITAVAALCAFTGAKAEADQTDPSEPPAPSPEADYAQDGAEFHFADGTVFTCNGVSYDLTEQYEGVNAINDIRRAGKYLVIDGHVGPKNNMYFIFDTESGTFAKSFPGVNLIWRGDDLSTAVYSFWSDILDYDGNGIAQLALPESEYIYSLDFSEDGRQIVASIVSDDGNDRTEIYTLDGTRVDENASAQSAEGSMPLPRYEYHGEDPYLAAVCEWTVRGGEQARYWEAEVTIPAPLIADVDDSDPRDIRVWGNFWEFSYTPQGTTLFCVSGGERPGLLHLRAADGGYEVYDAEMVGDGETYGKDMQRIFGELRMAKLDALDRETVRAQYLADYVLQNGLPFTQYQDYGWDPVHIPGTPESAQPAQ